MTAPVVPGEYLLEVSRYDHYAHETSITRLVKVHPPPDPPPQQPQQAAPVVELVVPAPVDALRDAALRDLARLRLSPLLRRGAPVRFAATEAGTASVALLDARGHRLAAARRLVQPGGVTLRLRPTRRGRRLGRHHRAPSRVRLSAAFAPTGGMVARRTVALNLRH